MALSLSVLDTLTAFLGLTEAEINSGKSLLADYFTFQGREYFGDANVTVICYNAGDFFEITIDHDSDYRCINQKTFASNMPDMIKHILPDKTGIDVFFDQNGFWPEIFVPRLGTNVKFSLGRTHNGDFIQSDIWL